MLGLRRAGRSSTSPCPSRRPRRQALHSLRLITKPLRASRCTTSMGALDEHSALRKSNLGKSRPNAPNSALKKVVHRLFSKKIRVFSNTEVTTNNTVVIPILLQEEYLTCNKDWRHGQFSVSDILYINNRGLYRKSRHPFAAPVSPAAIVFFTKSLIVLRTVLVRLFGLKPAKNWMPAEI